MDSISPSSCRLCLKEPAPDAALFSTFDTYQGNVLADLVEELFSVKITMSDHLRVICLSCVDRINTVRKIWQVFVANDQKLQSFMRHQATEISAKRNEAYEPFEVCLPGKESIRPKSKVAAPTKYDDFLHVEDSNDNSTELVCEKFPNNIEQPQMQDIDFAPLYESDADIRSDDKGDNCNAKRRRNTKAESCTKKTEIPQNKCYFCEHIFRSAIELTYHLPIHSALVPYTCPECTGQVFNKVRSANSHIRLHNAHERPFRCRICPLRFVTRTNSLTHERKMHRFKKKQKAAIKKQKSPSVCVRQQRSGEHRCDVCAKIFSSRHNLDRHLMIHTGESPFKCTQCNRCFRQYSQLNLHQKVHRAQKASHCDLCDMTFLNISVLAKHRKTVHSSSG